MSGPICEQCGQDGTLYKEPERIAALERQLAEAQGKLDAVREWRDKWHGPEPLGYDGSVSRTLARILKGE